MPCPLGALALTRGAAAALRATETNTNSLIERHAAGDWGEISAEDRYGTNCALLQQDRILSAYNLVDGTKLWIITEDDRSLTTILRAGKY